METAGHKAGHLIKSGAVATCLTCWHKNGRTGHAWEVVRRVLHETYPEARWNSREAVVRIAQAAAGVAREMKRRGKDWQPRNVPDARRLIRDAHRVNG
jgi:hypothetical protein